MAAMLLSGPASEPLMLAEAKAHLKVDTNDEDGLIQTLITAARLHVETLTERALITQNWRLIRDAWPRGRVLQIPIGPVQAINDVRIYDDDDVVATVSAENYLVEVAGVPARLAMRGGRAWPKPGRALAGIEIDFTAGYGPEPQHVPASLRQAVLLLAAHWFTHREPVALGNAPLPVPGTVDALLSAYKRQRL